MHRSPLTFLRLFSIVPAALAALWAQASERVALDVPYVPTPQAVVDRMLELGEVGKNDYVIDLGSGDGRIPVTAAKKYGVRALGVDIDPKRIEEANENAREAEVTTLVEFRRENLFDTPIADASVLTMYLLPTVNLKLKPRVLDELKPGSRVVSHAFSMGDWQPDHFEKVEGSSIYLWIVPAKVDGRWTIAGDKSFTIELTQSFQEVRGSAVMNGRTVPLTGVTLRGDRLAFTLDGQTYAGRINGLVIEAVETAGTGRNWRATRR
jgi:SAM-dependent methyltransferase